MVVLLLLMHDGWLLQQCTKSGGKHTRGCVAATAVMAYQCVQMMQDVP